MYEVLLTDEARRFYEDADPVLVRKLNRCFQLDRLLWEERETFLMVIGERELEHARSKQRSSRSHWWWYLDELKALPQPLKERVERLSEDSTPA